MAVGVGDPQGCGLVNMFWGRTNEKREDRSSKECRQPYGGPSATPPKWGTQSLALATTSPNDGELMSSSPWRGRCKKRAPRENAAGGAYSNHLRKMQITRETGVVWPCKFMLPKEKPEPGKKREGFESVCLKKAQGGGGEALRGRICQS